MSPSAFGAALLITGPESLLAQRLVEQRRDKALAEEPDAEVKTVSAASLESVPLAEVIGATLFTSHTVAIIDDLGACPPGAVDALVTVAANPPGDLCLILVHDGGNKGRGILNQLKKAKIPTETVKAVPAYRLGDFVAAEARRCGVKLAGGAADELVAAVGNDLRSLAGAVSQLAADADGTTIDPVLVKRYFAGRAEVSSFAVADAVMAGNAPLAVERLRWALQTGAAPVLVTSALAASFRSMGRYLDAQRGRLRGEDLARELGMPTWKLKGVSANSRNWTTAGIAEGLRLIATADAQVKGAASEPEFPLERLVLGLLGLRRR